MAPISWPDEVDDILTGDLTAAVSYLTPAGGAVVIGVAPCGLRCRDQGTIGFTTSLGFPRKLERIARDPRVALAYHAREHGFAAAPHFILAQGTATADVSPTPERINAFLHQTQPYLGPIKQGPMWNSLMREYYYARVFLDVHVTRMSILTGDNSTPTVAGEQWPGVPAPQPAPKNGTAPRVDMTATARRVARLPHRLLAYRGHDGFPVILPIHLTGHDKSGLRLAPAHTALPPGARRARPPRPRLPATPDRARHPNTHRMARRSRRRNSRLRPPHHHRIHRTTPQDTAADRQRPTRQIRHSPSQTTRPARNPRTPCTRRPTLEQEAVIAPDLPRASALAQVPTGCCPPRGTRQRQADPPLLSPDAHPPGQGPARNSAAQRTGTHAAAMRDRCRFRDEFLATEQFDTLLEAQILAEDWRNEYNTTRPHGAQVADYILDHCDRSKKIGNTPRLPYR